MRAHVLAARLDNLGDVLLAGPAVRALASRADRVTMLCGPRGRASADLLPGVDDVVVHRAAWIDPDPTRVDRAEINRLVGCLARLEIDEAVIFTSFHQSPLPLALILRLAGVPRVAAISEDYPGSLLDLRHRIADDIHEVERALSLVAAFGYGLPDGDDGRLALHPTAPDQNPLAGHRPYVVVHPGASMPARTWPSSRHTGLVQELVRSGRRVVVTGGPHEATLTRRVAGPPGPEVVDAAGMLTWSELAAVVRDASVVVTGNTGPAHLAAAVGTSVVSLYAPTVPAVRWRPWRVPHILLGWQDIGCAGCRARECPVDGHPCLSTVTVDDVIHAVDQLAFTNAEVHA